MPTECNTRSRGVLRLKTQPGQRALPALKLMTEVGNTVTFRPPTSLDSSGVIDKGGFGLGGLTGQVKVPKSMLRINLCRRSNTQGLTDPRCSTEHTGPFFDMQKLASLRCRIAVQDFQVV